MIILIFFGLEYSARNLSSSTKEQCQPVLILNPVLTVLLLPPIRAKELSEEKEEKWWGMPRTGLWQWTSECQPDLPSVICHQRDWPIGWWKVAFPQRGSVLTIQIIDVLRNGKKAGRHVLHVLSGSQLGTFVVFEEWPLLFHCLVLVSTFSGDA